MALSARTRATLIGGGGILLVAVGIIAFAHNDPPIDIAGGSIHGKVIPFKQMWHSEDNNDYSYRTDAPLAKDHIVIRDYHKKILVDCHAPNWTISLIKENTQIAVAQVTNDGNGNIHLTSLSTATGQERWSHSAIGLNPWDIYYNEDKIHITIVGLSSSGGDCGNQNVTFPDPNWKWHVRIGD